MSAVSDLLTLSTHFAAATGLSESTVSGRVLHGGNRLDDLRSGRSDIGVRRLATAIQWFSDHWPENAEWPADIPRPGAAPSAAAEAPAAPDNARDPAEDGPAPTSLITNAAFALDWHKQKIADSETDRANRAEQVLETVRAAVAVKGRVP